MTQKGKVIINFRKFILISQRWHAVYMQQEQVYILYCNKLLCQRKDNLLAYFSYMYTYICFIAKEHKILSQNENHSYKYHFRLFINNSMLDLFLLQNVQQNGPTRLKFMMGHKFQ